MDNKPQITVEPLPSTSASEPVTSPVVTDSIQHMAIAERYGIVNANKQESDKLQTIWDYAKSKSQSEDVQEVIWQVIDLEATLGAPRMGESKLDRLYRYIRLRKQESVIQEELRNTANVSPLPHLRFR